MNKTLLQIIVIYWIYSIKDIGHGDCPFTYFTFNKTRKDIRYDKNSSYRRGLHPNHINISEESLYSMH